MNAVRVAFAAVLSALLFAPGCGYRWGSTYDANVRTIAVPIFENDTFNTGLEVELADALAKTLQRATPWRVTRQANADTTIAGVIRGSELDLLSTNPVTGLAQEQAITYTVDFEWRDNRTGELILERQNFQSATTFIPAQGLDGSPGERYELGSRDAVEELADRIVAELRGSW